MSKPIVRPLQDVDVEPICAIALRAWGAIHAGYRKEIGNDEFYERVSHGWRTRKADTIRDRANRSPDNVIVAELDGVIVGFVTFALDQTSGIAEILDNAVDPEFQGRGIGSILYQAVLDVFRSRNMQYAVVSTGYEDEGHAPARIAYQKRGFKKMRASVTYWREL